MGSPAATGSLLWPDSSWFPCCSVRSVYFRLCVGFGLIGIGLAFLLRYGIDRRLDEERRGPLADCGRLLRKLRADGIDEEELRRFVAKFAGRQWEELFETLFGYEAKVAARHVLQRGITAGLRDRHAGWRDPILNFIDRIETGQEARERVLLQGVEQARLQAAGMPERAARSRAVAAASAMVQAAGKIRRAEADRVRIGQGPRTGQSAALPPSVRDLAKVPSSPEIVTGRRSRMNRQESLFLAASRLFRGLLASALLAGFGLWAHQNGLFPWCEAGGGDGAGSLTPLEIEGVPNSITHWADGFNTGMAGILLLASLFYRGKMNCSFALLGAAVTVGAHRFGIRAFEPFRDHHVALMLGTILCLIGFRASPRPPGTS